MKNSKSTTTTIGIVLPYLKSRGTEKQALRLAKGFQKQGFKVILFNIQGWGYFFKAFQNAGIEVVNVGPSTHEGERRVSKFRLFKLAYLAKKHGCNFLLSKAGASHQICARAARLARIPSAVVFSSRILKYRPGKSKSPLRKKIALFRFLWKFGFPSRFVTVSTEGAENLVSNFPALSDRVVAIRSGVDADEIRKKSSDTKEIKKKNRFRLCYAGSIRLKTKGLGILVDVLDTLVHEKEQLDIELLLVGSGDDEAELRRRVKQRGLEHNVTYAGEQENPYPFMKSADLFILPSRKEGMPGVLLEAMALGVCSISTDCLTGPKEIIENGKNGILVPVDDKSMLVAEILRLKENPELRRKLAENGRRTIQTKFSAQRMVGVYIKMIREILAKKEL